MLNCYFSATDMSAVGYRLKCFLFTLTTASIMAMAIAAGALCFLPASYLTQALVELSQGRVIALDTQGNIWNGRARLALRSGGQTETARAALLPSELQWQIAKIHWFPLALEIRLRGEPLVQQAFSLWVGLNKTRLSPGILYLPAKTLESAGAPFNTIQPGGDLFLSWTAMSFESRQIHGQARMEWREASSVLSKVAPLGSYRVMLSIQEGQDELELSTLSGPLFLNGSGKWNNGRWQMNGMARAEPTQRDDLAPLMTLLGQQLPDGSVQWKAGNR
jgi:general secretion pathway protein N